jgi:transposase
VRAITPGRKLRLPKIRDVPVQWSRALPSPPSSVTVIKDAVGRYFASFVVQAQPGVLPAADAVVGVDLGLAHFAVLSDGRKIASPRFLRRAERKLRRRQRELSRKQKGSSNRDKDGPKPLHVRTWQCRGCGAWLDRDVNAAVNVARAAGLAVTACRAQVRPGAALAQRGEAGTHPTSRSTAT